MFVFFFFFKQQTAYEMRISDWSSDVCSSDLVVAEDEARHVEIGLAASFRQIVGEADKRQSPAVFRAGDNGIAPDHAIFQRKFHVARRYRLEPTFVRRVPDAGRSEERRVGKEWVRTGKSRWSAIH